MSGGTASPRTINLRGGGAMCPKGDTWAYRTRYPSGTHGLWTSHPSGKAGPRTTRPRGSRTNLRSGGGHPNLPV